MLRGLRGRRENGGCVRSSGGEAKGQERGERVRGDEGLSARDARVDAREGTREE